MGYTERQRIVLAEIDRQGACAYAELAKLTGVSDMTIRRDVDKLAAQNKVIKILGGVQRASAPPDFYESQLILRLSIHQSEKKAIAAMALEQIEPRQTIFLDGSTTCLELARLIAERKSDMTIITPSLPVCYELSKGKTNTTLMIGGEYDPATMCCAGTTSESQARNFFVDCAFVSTKGFIPLEGTFESSVGLFRIKQIAVAQSERVILLVDHSKFGQRALCKVLDISEIGAVITDSETPPHYLEALEKAGVQTYTAMEAVNNAV